MLQLQNGPFIQAMAHVGRPDFTVHTVMLPGENSAPPLLIADDGSFSTPNPLSLDQLLEPLPKEVLKASGVARARNSPKSTIYAALIAQEFNRMLSGRPDYNPNRVALGVCSSSGSAATDWEYETDGVTLGWLNTNTLLMPSALPSAAGTQVSAAVKTHNATITFINDIMGMCAAMEYTHVNFFHERADYSFLIATEELSIPLVKLITHKKIFTQIERDGASGLLLCREKPGERAWRLSLYQHTVDPKAIVVPDGWQDAGMLSITLPALSTPFSSLIFPYAVHKVCSQQGKDKAILIIEVESRSTYAFGFQLTDKQ